MQISMSLFEQYVELFRKKVANLEKTAKSKRKGRNEPKVDDEEFVIELPFPGEEPEEVSSRESVLFMFLNKFEDALPKTPKDKFEFLVEAHLREIIQFYQTVDRHNGSVQVVFDGVYQSNTPKTPLDFLEVFFCFSAVSKSVGISAKNFPALIVAKFKEWFPQDALTVRLNEIEKVSDEYIYLYTLAHFVLSGCSKRIDIATFKKFVPAKEFLLFMQSVNSATHPLLKSNEMSIQKDMWDDEVSITTSKKSISLILPDFEAGVSKNFDGYDLIAPEDISAVSLHYSAKTQASLDRLKSILKCCPSETWNTRKLGILLAGEAGCGKTEFVAQACRELGYYYMNVGGLNSKWVGETEQNIKRILEIEYPKMMKEYDNKVILCMNEMDQIIGVKTSVTTSSTFHTNAGVSQILRSLDSFKGIIVGTLNELSPERCEPSAIRRFQHLINFTLPDFEARKSIWESREGFWQQNATLINRLAQFELSGSDIHSVCEKGFFLQFAGDEFAENSIFELIEEQVELGKKTRYSKSAASAIGFQKLAS